jgi:hypothetical protein
MPIGTATILCKGAKTTGFEDHESLHMKHIAAIYGLVEAEEVLSIPMQRPVCQRNVAYQKHSRANRTINSSNSPKKVRGMQENGRL